MGRAFTIGMLLSMAAALVGCYQSVSPQEDEVISDAASQKDIPEGTNDSGQGESDSDEHAGEGNEYCPIEQCVYAFHVLDQVPSSEVLGYESVRNVPTFTISFIQGVDQVVIEGPDFDASGQVRSDEGALMAGGTETIREYRIEDFLAGGMLRIWKGENDEIMARLEIFGSGVPVVRSYRGYLTLFDCGPPIA